MFKENIHCLYSKEIIPGKIGDFLPGVESAPDNNFMSLSQLCFNISRVAYSISSAESGISEILFNKELRAST
jgi:hypothetical protein